MQRPYWQHMYQGMASYHFFESNQKTARKLVLPILCVSTFPFLVKDYLFFTKGKQKPKQTEKKQGDTKKESEELKVKR